MSRRGKKARDARRAAAEIALAAPPETPQMDLTPVVERQSMTHLAIRAANPADVEQILDFVRRLAEYEKLGHDVVATPERIRRALFGGQRYAECILAEADGKPAGFALFFHTFSTFLALPGIYLEDLFVLPERRGQGVGKALLGRVAAIAVERGCGRLEWAVLDWNEPAIAFYRSLGSRPLEEWTVHRISGEALTSLATATETTRK